jgi:hypothetical protein
VFFTSLDIVIFKRVLLFMLSFHLTVAVFVVTVEIYNIVTFVESVQSGYGIHSVTCIVEFPYLKRY